MIRALPLVNRLLLSEEERPVRIEYARAVYAAFVLLATIFNTVLIAVIVRRLLGVAVGWPRTLFLSAIVTTAASPPLRWILELIGVGPLEQGTSDLVATSLVSLLYGAWVLALEVSFLAVAEAIVPTGTLPGPIELLRGLPGWLRRTRRYLGILGIAARHGLLRYLGSSRPSSPGAPRPRRDTATSLREALTQGGVTFVKLGQMLATRPDLLPMRYVEELSRLHTQVPAEPWGTAQRTLHHELGVPPERVFAHIDPQPLAAASVGQVHAATLQTGEQVVVKVQRATASDLVRGDLDIIARLAALAERRAGWARRLGVRELAAGFRRSLDEELDYRVELHNLATLRGSDQVIIPRAHPAQSSRRVLTMDRLDGVPLSNASEEIAALTPEARFDLARALLDVVLQQVFVDGVFHADLHGGNVLLLDDGRLALLDFGAVGRLDRGARSALIALMVAIERQDGAAAAKRLTRLLEAPGDIDIRLLERQMADLVMRVGSLPGEELFAQMFAIAMDHGLRVSGPVAAALRAIGALEGTLRLLSPDVDVIALARERAATVAQGSLGVRTLADDAKDQVVTILPLVRRLPEQLSSIVTRLDQPNLGVRMTLAPDARSERFLSGLVQQVVLAVLAATSAACGTALALSDIGPMLAPRLRLTVYLGLVLLLFAYVLGSRLVVSAFRGRHEMASDVRDAR